MNFLIRIVKGLFIWFAITFILFLILSSIFPSDMPLFLSFFVLIFPIYCAVHFSKVKPKDGEKQKKQNTTNKPQTQISLTKTEELKSHKIVITRKHSLASSAKCYKVFLDGILSGTLYNGKSVTLYTTPGQHRIDFKGYRKIETSISLFVQEQSKVTNISTRISLKTGKIVAENSSPVDQTKSTSTQHSTYTRPATRSTSMARIDTMEGHAFEEFAADLLRKLGYERVKVTPGSGDQGVDIIAVKGDKKYAIQCKRYAQKLGNKPVQEVFAGKTIYGCNVAVVLTNNYFTEGAKEAARAVGVELWDRDTLQRMITYAEFKAGV